MQALLKPLLELAEYEDIVKKKKEAPGVLMLTGCVNSQKTHMMYALSDGCCYKVIACSSEAKAKQIYEEYRFLDAAISFYPAKDLLFYQADIRSKELISQRMQVIQAVLKGEPITVVASFDAFMDALLPKEMIKSRVIKICSDETLNLDELSVKLAQCGYDREIEVAGPGQFAVRGGILDVYPLTEELPVRIELWGDEVDSIRTFDPETQRSIEKLDEVEVFPATEFPEEEEKRVSFLDYFEKENTILFLDEPVRLKEKGEGVEEEFLEAQKRRAQSGYEVADSEAVLFTTQEIMRKMNEYSSVGFQALDMRCPGVNIRASYNLQTKNVDPYNRSFELLTQDLKKMKRNQSRVILLSGSRTRARRLAEDLRDYNLSSFYSEDMDREVEPGEIMTAYGYIAEGYEYPLLNFVVISETDIFGKNKRKKKRRTTYEGRKIQSFSELKPGDYVVHENHGLGIYQGIEKIEVDKISKDYMKISYAKGGNLYIPATQLDLIQKYAGSDSKKPKLNRLGTQEWTKTKAKVRGAVKEIAKDLVELYAARQNQDGFVYGEDTVWQKEFEEMFPYEETEDQLLAINAVKKDMESHKIMDRLICGDVGYGKTEIAIRAAFKAVQENKQVVYLVPTTILAQQHYNTFCQRMKDFPVRVDLMCRFRTPAQQRDTIQNLKRGLVDIVVGTHRVLSDDIEYKDLGLLIIDEEQRFGVQHKEKIKKLKKNVDVLTLTATPIPRTLHMSLIGIRDMSVLEPPMDRVPIQTYVMEYNDEMVREAIERECARNGQVYYVYNRVEDIAEVTAHIQKLVPELNVSFAHGQMKEHELEKIMYDFINGDIDVLVSTTIIETGLDISNVNTMIIHDADRLGLSQLYQLRGRVGRSGRMAYAFLLYRKDKLLKEIAEKRLAAIREFTDLGSGFKIAMRDLEIRGAGNLLGAEQHGHMEAVGYDMYCKMLNEAVKHLKGELSEEDTFTTALDVNVDAYIPDSYIPNEYHKLDIYKRIAAIESEEEMDDMIEELIDRFGDIPKKVELLLEVARLKNLAHQAYVTEVTQKGVTYTFRMYEKAKIHVERIPDLLKQFPEDLSFKADISDPKFIYQKKKKTKRGEVENPIEVVKKVLIGIKGLLD